MIQSIEFVAKIFTISQPKAKILIFDVGLNQIFVCITGKRHGTVLTANYNSLFSKTYFLSLAFNFKN